ncbi:hypothetical protein POSPLADRAFT_1053727 [Postia placenta MAD-698-R-SB12]|uniref:RlpA-like protein double-psi beta-barrel domain-containing protein n=1 Tax=Postia placenta MAD-698-R-SB12 TaxID=670580 RepID=A0A1X6N8M6_9APHY|nr:hypothetical protein POSPLADRAFT_1053727 [Postia placenta MAD-698-R-SB12]OSX64924.1 hypothetical protein POSPLADRAFT_1053727 [Postia placenta MAD-698-R-SB12]
MHAPTRLSFSVSLLVLSFFGVVLADTHAVGRSLHHWGSRKHADVEARRTNAKRVDNARLSYYDAGQNACGSVDTDSDFIVALNTDQWSGGQYCYQTITISYGGKSTQAKITDECPGCPSGGLDLSRGLFDFFAPESQGIIYGTWVFGDGAPPTTSSTWVAPSTIWTPTSTWVAPTTFWTPTSTWEPTSTYSAPSSFSSYSSISTFSSVLSISTSSLPSSSATPSTTASATATATAAAQESPAFDQGNLNQFNMALVGMSGLLYAANWT